MATFWKSAVVLTLFWTFSASATRLKMQEWSWYKDYYPQLNQYCFNGCSTVVDFITFDLPAALAAETDYLVIQCSNTLQIQSIFTCAQAYCTYDEAVAGRSYMVERCDEIGISVPSIAQYHLSDGELAAIPRINSTAALSTAQAPLNTTTIPVAEWASLGERTVRTFYETWNLGFDFSFALIGFWAVVIVAGMVHRINQVAKAGNRDVSSRESATWRWIRRNLILPATFRSQCQEANGAGTIPPRLETSLLVVYLLINIVFCLPGYNLFMGNQFYATKKLQLARYVADRTGFLSIAQLPMVWVFAARNDPFLWLTGWSFATYNRFHRWIARISTVHAIVHSIAYSVFALYFSTPTSNYYAESWKAQYWYTGEIATIVMALMMGASAYYFRARCYDLFLMVHIGASVVFLVCLWYHVRIFDGEFSFFIWPCIAIWSIDRILRLGRIIYMSTNGVKATASYDASARILRLDVTEILTEKPIVPGQFYYLYMPDGLRGYESHPFTLCSWYRSDAQADTSSKGPFDDIEIKTNVRSSSEDDSNCDLAHTFLIQVHGGMTDRLQKKLATSIESGVTRQTILLEGPYGDPLDLSHYSDVLIVCGGFGITAAISHANFLVSKSSCTTRVVIVWAVRQQHLADDVCSKELAIVLQNKRVSMLVYLTKAAKEGSQDPAEMSQDPPYEIRFGRPDIKRIMKEYRQKSTRNLAIATCGTPQMADVCRAAVVSLLREPGVDVEYFNNNMMW